MGLNCVPDDNTIPAAGMRHICVVYATFNSRVVQDWRGCFDHTQCVSLVTIWHDRRKANFSWAILAIGFNVETVQVDNGHHPSPIRTDAVS